jgi:cytochrome c553
MLVKVTVKRVVAGLAVLAAGGMALAWSGLINIGASTGHSAVTDWFLHWAMRNTARTYAALTVEKPAADATGLVSAAGHYAATCATCHGAPGEPPSPVMRAASPPAPDLRSTAATYSDAELFWIIKHGVKFTGMPAWPALVRDDEIRRMTAFVRRLPQLTPLEYRELAYGSNEGIAGARSLAFEDALDECERCHTDHGRGQADIPILAGQKQRYLRGALEDFASGRRPSGVMQAAASRVAAPLRRALADHYAGLEGLKDVPVIAAGARAERPPPAAPIVPSTSAAPILQSTSGAPILPSSSVAAILPSASAVGAEAAAVSGATAASVVAYGIPELDLPPCSKCHSPGKRPDYPILAGQKAEYLASRLHVWRADEDSVESRQPDEPMPTIARRIPAYLIEPLARYIAAAEAPP